MIQTRDARRDEFDTIRELTLRAYGEYASIMAPEAWAKLQEAVITGLTKPNQAACIVAEENGVIKGSVLLFPANADAYAANEAAPSASPEIRLLAVPPESRGLGVAKALMNECVRRARAEGANFLGLHTSQSMRAAVALYTAMGFVRVPETDFVVDGAELIEGYRLPL